MSPRTPRPTPFPYTTLFRSNELAVDPALDRHHVRRLHCADRLEHDRHVLLGDGAGGDRHGLRSAAAFLGLDRKSTRLNSSYPSISYAVFCLKKNRLDMINDV